MSRHSKQAHGAAEKPLAGRVAVVAGALWGAVAIASEDPLPPDSENRLGAFCELASLAVASAQARADLSASRARVVRAGDEQRRKLERSQHRVADAFDPRSLSAAEPGTVRPPGTRTRRPHVVSRGARCRPGARQRRSAVAL